MDETDDGGGRGVTNWPKSYYVILLFKLRLFQDYSNLKQKSRFQSLVF